MMMSINYYYREKSGGKAKESKISGLPSSGDLATSENEDEANNADMAESSSSSSIESSASSLARRQGIRQV